MIGTTSPAKHHFKGDKTNDFLTLALVIAAIVLQVYDAWSTIKILRAGGRETNLLMRKLMELIGIAPAIITKSILISGLYVYAGYLGGLIFPDRIHYHRPGRCHREPPGCLLQIQFQTRWDLKDLACRCGGHTRFCMVTANAPNQPLSYVIKRA